MKLCMMSLVMDGYTVEEIVQTAVDCKMSAIDWISCHGKPAKYLKKICADAGLPIASHTMFQLEALTTGVQPREAFLRTLADAVELGAPILMVPPFPDAKIASLSEARRRWLEFYAWAAPIGKAAGVQVTLEPTGFINSSLVTGSELLEALEQVPELRLTFDVGNLATADSDIIAGYQQVKKYIVHFHLKDWSICDTEQANYEKKRSGKYFGETIINQGNLDLHSWWKQVDDDQKEILVNLETFDPSGKIPCAQVMKTLSAELRNW